MKLSGKVIIPNGMKRISNSAFYVCRGLNEVVIPDGVESIGDYAFFNCEALGTVEIPKTVSHIGDGAFEYAPNLRLTVSWRSYALDWAVKNGVLDISILDEVVPAENAWRLPAALTTIEKEAFLNLGMIEVVIPDNVTSIGERAFAGCTELMYVYIPYNVQTIETDAFEGCGSFAIICPEYSDAALYAEEKGIIKVEY